MFWRMFVVIVFIIWQTRCVGFVQRPLRVDRLVCILDSYSAGWLHILQAGRRCFQLNYLLHDESSGWLLRRIVTPIPSDTRRGLRSLTKDENSAHAVAVYFDYRRGELWWRICVTYVIVFNRLRIKAICFPYSALLS